MRRFFSVGLVAVAAAASGATNRTVSTIAELHRAVTGAKYADTIILEDGVYDFTQLKCEADKAHLTVPCARVTIRSRAGDPAKCILVGGGERRPGRAFHFTSGDTRLEGVTISNFFVKGSAAAVLPGKWSDSSFFSNCVFAACRSTAAGGAIQRASAPGAYVGVTDSVFVDCESGKSGGALSAAGHISVDRCRFIRCRANGGAGGAGERITARNCVFEDCYSAGRGGSGGGGAVSYGNVADCVFRRCGSAGYAVLRNGNAAGCVFEDCRGSVGYMQKFEDSRLVGSGGAVHSVFNNCEFDGCLYGTNGASSMLSLSTLTNCTIRGTTGGDRRRWNSGMIFGGKLVRCLLAGNRSARDFITQGAVGGKNKTILIDTLVTNEIVAVPGIGFDAGARAKKLSVMAREKAAKDAQAKKSGVHELLRIDFDDCKPRRDGGLYAGFWSGSWGDSKCSYSLVPGYGGRGQAMRCDLKGMVGGQLQIFSQPWVMWQNRWYRLRFKARGIDHPGVVEVGVRKYGYPWSMLGWPFKKFNPTNEWKEYTIVKKSGHDVSGGFGILIGLGDVGCVEFDDFIVEALDYDPTERDAQANENPPVRGNLIPRGSFETIGDPFFIYQRTSAGIWPVWNEPWTERSQGAREGRYCIRFPPPPKCPDETLGWMKNKKPGIGRTFQSVAIPVASGCRYKLSGWYRLEGPAGKGVRTAYCSFGAASGKKWGFGKRFVITDRNRRKDGKCVGPVPGEWQKLEVVSEPVPVNVSWVTVSIEINGSDVYLDDLDLRIVDDGAAAGEDPPDKPYELQAAFARGDARVTPKIVTWGEKLPLCIAAMPVDGKTGGKIGVTLRVVAYPDRTTFEKKMTLAAGEEKRLDVDPGANGILRVELEADDPRLAEPVESVMARLPEPRKTGKASSFGTHLRMCPYFVNYAAAIGIKWQRLHDCSNMCKMKWANPAPGEYQWADEIVDYIRSKGLNILALPDYPSAYIMTKDADGKTVYDNEAYKTWCRELAKHYKGRIDHFEIWNEPYMPYFYKRGAKEFGATFNAGAEGIREGNPDAKVVGWCTEFTNPRYVAPFINDYPVEKKPDYNSVHYYYTSVPGDGDVSYERIVSDVRKRFGERCGSEIWNTEGNMALTHTFYTRMRRFNRFLADRGIAFGTRGWAETISAGISKTFIYTTHNTDNPWVGGFMTLIDYDRSVTPKAAATATTAYFIDALKPVAGLGAVKGCKYRAFSGDGRSVALVWDDVLEEGRAKLSPNGAFDVYDAMGNALEGERELSAIPVFVESKGSQAGDLVAKIRASMRFDAEKSKKGK